MTGPFQEGHKPNYLRIALLCALLVGVAACLAQIRPTWAQPHQDGLRGSHNSPVPPPTNGPTATASPTVAPGVQRALLQEGRDDYAGTSDHYMDAYSSRYVSSRDGNLNVKGADVESALIRFDLNDLFAALPPDANIVDVKLLFYVTSYQGRALDVAAYRVLQEWQEDEISWDYYHTTTRSRWAAEGCNGVDEDRVETPDDTVTLRYHAVYQALNVTESLQYWRQHPDENHGWLIKGVSASTASYRLASSRASVHAQRPLLCIDYTETGVTVTPSATTSGEVTSTPTTSPGATSTQTVTQIPVIPTATPEPTPVTLTAIQDTHIDAWFPTDTHGGLGYMYCISNYVTKPMVQFDLSDLPEGAQVISATLQLYTGSSAGNHPLSVAVHRLSTDWQEATANWEVAYTGEDWTAQGASDPDHDYDPTPLDGTTIEETNHAYTWDVSAAAQAWAEQPTANHGLILLGLTGTHTRWSFLSSEVSTLEQRPQLILTYFIAPPEPTQTLTPTPSATASMTPTSTSSPSESSTPTCTPTATSSAGDLSLRAFVYLDDDRDGWPDAGEPGIAGVTVDLLTMGYQLLDQKITGADGICTFAGLAEGWYRLREHTPSGYGSSTDDQVMIYLNTDQTTVSFGDYLLDASTPTPTPTQTVSPDDRQIVVTVYEDTNRDGWRDAGEAGLNGVTIKLYDSAHLLLDQGVTTGDGSCTFEGLSEGWYRLREYNLVGYDSSTKDRVILYLGWSSMPVTFGDYPHD